MSAVERLKGVIEECKSACRTLESLKRKELVRNRLKMVIVGFFLWRDIGQRISRIEERRNLLVRSARLIVEDFMVFLRGEMRNLAKSDAFISRDDEGRWQSLFETLRKILSYLELLSGPDREYYSIVLGELDGSRHFIEGYNEKLEKRILRQDLLKLKGKVLQAENEFNSLYHGQNYFSKRELHLWRQKWKYLIETLEDSVRKGIRDMDFENSIVTIIDYSRKGEYLVGQRNSEFMEEEMKRFKDFFESVEAYPLTDEQRKAIIMDEDNCLVIAGAGTGKTSTIVGKTGYLVKKGLASPDEILLIAFNKDVVSEMKQRISLRLGITPKVKTFHSFGLEVIAESRGTKPSVSELAEDRVKLLSKFLGFVRSMLSDEHFTQLLNEYFLYHFARYRSEFEFNSAGEYFDYLREFDIRSLKGDRVKSFEECDIANFLYINGVDYLYEEPYPVKTADVSHRQYRPDFFLPESGIYIEHFGVDRENKTAPYVPQREYLDKMNWARNIHKENNTRLIETYSYERQEGNLLKNLEQALLAKGVVFKPLLKDEIFDKLNELGRVDSFVQLLATFLDLYKSSAMTLAEIKDRVAEGDKRTLAFLDIFTHVYDEYAVYLEKRDEIDFNDMLNIATAFVSQGKYKSRFKYVLVDEFQDVSQSRYRFLKSLLDQNGSKLFCVGDDWQSIYRFTGSDISVMLGFEKNFEFSERSYLRETFRFGDKLCDFSTKFILQNPTQIEKKINSRKKDDKPAVTVIHEGTEEALEKILAQAEEKCEGKASIFIIGRYNYQKPENLQEISQRHPKLDVEFTTAHSSKGLEADYVIIIGLTGGEHGFPCQIADDPLLNLVLANQEPFPNAEERRLFYVAMTRAREHVYLIIDEEHNTSPFVAEIQRAGYEINSFGELLKATNCPVCRTGEIVVRRGKSGSFYSCSNYPYCEYLPKRCPQCKKGFLIKTELEYRCSDQTCSFHAEACTACKDGYLVLRKSRHGQFYGCSNYPNCHNIKREPSERKRYPRYIS